MKYAIHIILILLFSSCDKSVLNDKEILKDKLQGEWEYSRCCYKEGKLIINNNEWILDYHWFSQHPPERPTLCPESDVKREVYINNICNIDYISSDEILVYECLKTFSTNCGYDTTYLKSANIYKVEFEEDEKVILEELTIEGIATAFNKIYLERI